MTIWQNIKSAVSFDWLFGQPEKDMDLSWINNDFYDAGKRKFAKIEALNDWANKLDALADLRSSQKKANRPIRLQAQRVRREAREIENGDREFNGVEWVLKPERQKLVDAQG